jgi:hypothetical protein
MKALTPALKCHSVMKFAVAGVGMSIGLALGLGMYIERPSSVGQVRALFASGQASASAPARPAGEGAAADRRQNGSHFRQPDPLDFENHAGYVQIFNGHDLANWVVDPAVWHVEDGAIVGESTKKKPVDHSYISFHGFEVKDFDLKLEIEVRNGGGSGIQYRSKTGLPWRTHRPGQPMPNLNWLMTGPQADFWYPVNPTAEEYSGQFYSENTGLGILAWRGQVVESSPGKRPRLVGIIGNRSALGGYVKVNAWNQYMVMARGGTFIHIINGRLMAVYVDDDPTSSNNQPGLIGIELESTPCKVMVRDIWIKRLR